MIEKTQGIALRTAPYANTSRFVLWLTPDHGRIATLIKGALRPKSFFLGQFDLFYTCELLFYARERGGVHIARECAPIRYRAAFRRDWRACMLASYLADLTARALPARAPAPRVFDWLEAVLDALTEPRARLETVFSAELQLLDILGFRPALRRCSFCGVPVRPAPGQSFYSSRSGGAVCPTCAPGAPAAQPAPPDALILLGHWQSAPSLREARSVRCSRRQARIIARMLEDFLRYHLEVNLESRRIALTAALS